MYVLLVSKGFYMLYFRLRLYKFISHFPTNTAVIVVVVFHNSMQFAKEISIGKSFYDSLPGSLEMLWLDGAHDYSERSLAVDMVKSHEKLKFVMLFCHCVSVDKEHLYSLVSLDGEWRD